MLSRSVNNFTPEILQYNNKMEDGKIIVVYDFDERIALPAANLFFEKGVDNVFMLSGGLKKFGSEFPELTQGDLPRPPSPTGTNRSRMSHSSNVTTTSQKSVNSLKSQISNRSIASGTTSASGAWK